MGFIHIHGPLALTEDCIQCQELWLKRSRDTYMMDH